LERFGFKKDAAKTRLGRYTTKFLVKHFPSIGSKAASERAFATLKVYCAMFHGATLFAIMYRFPRAFANSLAQRPAVL
jgi:hypothetical protein